MMCETVSHMPTVGEIAKRLGVGLHRIQYVVRSRRIRPAGLAGNARVFSNEDVSVIANELRRIDSALEARCADQTKRHKR